MTALPTFTSMGNIVLICIMDGSGLTTTLLRVQLHTMERADNELSRESGHVCSGI